MIRIRQITADEIAGFVALTLDPEQRRAIHRYLSEQFDHGAMRPDWCFIAEADDQLIGRLAYWVDPKTGIPSDMLFFDVPWEHDYHTVGTQLFLESLPYMRALGATTLRYVLDIPLQAPQWQDFPEQRHDLLTALNFQIVRNTQRFVHDHVPIHEPPMERLRFRGMADVGADAMLAAIEQVSIGTRDRFIQQHRTTYGAAHAAQLMLNILQSMDYDPAWWQLAYTQQGNLVGLVMPTKTLATGTIGYIGVVPAQRGHGYSRDLLTHGTTTLHTAGIREILADTDLDNAPMANTFRRAGYHQVGTRHTYQVSHTT